MSLLQAAVLGVVQGVTEFLPVSSSAHLALFPWLFHWPDQGLAYDVALHWGTLAALVLYFRKDLIRLADHGLRKPRSQARRLLIGIVVATIPGVIAGLFLEDLVETVFRKPERMALSLMFFGILLSAADHWGKKIKKIEALDWRLCLGVGMAQALAVMPGVSRSGITITAALALGLRRPDAARFSFLLALPIIFGAGVLKLKDLVSGGGLDLNFFVGILMSALSGYAAVHFLLEFVKKRPVHIFAFYRVALGLLVLFLLSASPPIYPASKLGLSSPERAPAETRTAKRLQRDVIALSGRSPNRNAIAPKRLKRARDYVRMRMRLIGYRPSMEPYRALYMGGGIRDGTVFHNIAVSAGPEPSADNPLWVLGAHYDSAFGTPGADDNASGIAVLLELARRFKKEPPKIPIRFVAFSTEEPPAFGTKNMGSWHDAAMLKKDGVPVAGMISLEMLGYYDDRTGSQIYPPFTKWLVPETGDFIALVGNFGSRRFLNKVRANWPTRSRPKLLAKWLPEIQTIRLSDNASYWDAGFSALMLTDTAGYRNPHYHEETDLYGTLDYERMASLTGALETVLRAQHP